MPGSMARMSIDLPLFQKSCYGGRTRFGREIQSTVFVLLESCRKGLVHILNQTEQWHVHLIEASLLPCWARKVFLEMHVDLFIHY